MMPIAFQSVPRQLKSCSCPFKSLKWHRRVLTYHLPALLAAFLLSVPSSRAATYTINAQSGPWQYVNGGLNTSYQFGINDHLPPTVISLSPGQQVVVAYASGLIDIASTGWPPANSYVDANGVLALPNPNLSPHANGDTPSVYMGESAASPKYLGELVGTFANSTGQIVGTPFAIGDGPLTLLVPAAATRLQLGVNDNLFADNGGSWSIEVTVVPEPGGLTLLCLGAIALVIRRR